MAQFEDLSADDRRTLAASLKALILTDQAEVDALRLDVDSEEAKLQVLALKMGFTSLGALTGVLLAGPSGGLTLFAAVPNAAAALLEVAQFTTDANYIRGLQRRLRKILRRVERNADDLVELDRLDGAPDRP